MNKFILTLTMAILLASCGSSDNNYSSVQDLTQEYWRSNEPVEFTFTQNDTEAKNSIIMLVRHSPEYAYDKIFLAVETTTPSNKQWCDSVSIKLADSDKNWIGKDFTTHYDVKSFYRKEVQFDEVGDYKMKIKYYFPEDSLKGIQAIGLTVEKEKDGKK